MRSDGLSTICIILVVLFLKQVRSQNSPCPDVFTYDLSNWNGIITLPTRYLYGETKLVVTLAAVSLEAGKGEGVELVKNVNDATEDANQGKDVQYKVNFPSARGLPQVKSINVHGEDICTQSLDSKLQILTIESTTNFIANPATRNIPCTDVMQLEESNAILTIPVALQQPDVTIRVSLRYKGTFPSVYTHNHGLEKVNDTSNMFKLDMRYFEYLPYVLHVTVNNVIICHIPETDNLQLESYVVESKLQFLDSIPEWLTTFRFNNICGRRPAKASHTVIGGTLTQPQQFPWLVALFNISTGFDRESHYMCGGTLVSDKFVLTAAHCLVGFHRVQLELGRYNVEDTSEEIITRLSRRLIRHPEYTPNSGHGDIALVEMERIDEFNSRVKPICIWKFGSGLSTNIGTVVGWGHDSSGSRTDKPYETGVSMVSSSVCAAQDELLKNAISNNTFCAGGKARGPCYGDSGSGFYLNRNFIWYLRGIISTSLGDSYTCDTSKYAVYADVATFLDWLGEYLL